jgi:hypothetical protein
MFFYFAFTYLILLFLKRFRLSGPMSLVLISFLLFERVSLDFNHVPASLYRGQQYQKFVRSMTGTAVLDIPANWEINAYGLNPFYYGKPIVSGYFNWPAMTYENRQVLFDDMYETFVCKERYGCLLNGSDQMYIDKLLSKMSETGTTIVVLHKSMMGRPDCDVVINNTQILKSAKFEKVYSDDDVDVFQLI